MTLLSEHKADWRLMVDEAGENVVFRRLSPLQNVTAKAVPRGYKATELLGGILLGDREFRVMAEDLAAFSPRLRIGDKVVWNGRELNIQSVDAATVRVQGETIAYIITARG